MISWSETLYRAAYPFKGPLVTFWTVQCNIKQFYVIPTDCINVFLWLPEQTAIVLLNGINWLVFITERVTKNSNAFSFFLQDPTLISTTYTHSWTCILFILSALYPNRSWKLYERIHSNREANVFITSLPIRYKHNSSWACFEPPSYLLQGEYIYKFTRYKWFEKLRFLTKNDDSSWTRLIWKFDKQIINLIF